MFISMFYYVTICFSLLFVSIDRLRNYIPWHYLELTVLNFDPSLKGTLLIQAKDITFLTNKTFPLELYHT